MRARYDNENYGPLSTGSFRTAETINLLPAPQPLIPEDGVNLPGTQALFRWQPVDGAAFYQLVIGWNEPYGSSAYYITVYDTERDFPYLPPQQQHCLVVCCRSQ
ncbi:MAG: hypothetical protein OHK0052_08770 [Anaerolineales bacterium]